MTYHEGRRNVIILRGLRIESRATSGNSTGSVPEGLEPQNPVFKKDGVYHYSRQFWKLAYCPQRSVNYCHVA